MSLEVYEKIEDELKSIYRSRLQTQILLSLGDGEKNLSQLREITGSSSQAIIPKIRKLENNYFVKKDGFGYHLTPIGKILTSKIDNCIMTIGVITKFKDFWRNHSLEWIPEPLFNEIGNLFNSELITDTSEDVFKTLANYLKYFREARQVLVVSSMTSNELIDAVIERLAAGVPVEVLITKDVFEKLDKEPYNEKISKMIGFSNLKLMVTEEYIRVGLTVTEKFLSMGLYKKNGMLYDFSVDMFSFDRKALEWGEKFFQYYKDRSVRVMFPQDA